MRKITRSVKKTLLLFFLLPFILFAQTGPPLEFAHFRAVYQLDKVRLHFSDAQKSEVHRYADQRTITSRERDQGWRAIELGYPPDQRQELRYLALLVKDGWEIVAVNTTEREVEIANLEFAERLTYEYVLQRPARSNTLTKLDSLAGDPPDILRRLYLDTPGEPTLRISVKETEEKPSGGLLTLHRTLIFEEQFGDRWSVISENKSLLLPYRPGVDVRDPFEDLRFEEKTLLLEQSAHGEKVTNYTYHFSIKRTNLRLLKLAVNRSFTDNGCPRTERLEYLPTRGLVTGKIYFESCGDPKRSEKTKVVSITGKRKTGLAIDRMKFGDQQIEFGKKREYIIAY